MPRDAFIKRFVSDTWASFSPHVTKIFKFSRWSVDHFHGSVSEAVIREISWPEIDVCNVRGLIAYLYRKAQLK